jgi:hypothetical protein
MDNVFATDYLKNSGSTTSSYMANIIGDTEAL